jgi:hypothetical protein
LADANHALKDGWEEGGHFRGGQISGRVTESMVEGFFWLSFCPGHCDVGQKVYLGREGLEELRGPNRVTDNKNTPR